MEKILTHVFAYVGRFSKSQVGLTHDQI